MEQDVGNKVKKSMTKFNKNKSNDFKKSVTK